MDVRQRKISELMTRDPNVVDADANMAQVEELINRQKSHSMPVIDASGRCFGIITSKDLVRLKRSPSYRGYSRAWEVCSHNVVNIDVNATVKQAADSMIEHNIHHLMVVDGEAIRGIVTAVDLLKTLR